MYYECLEEWSLRSQIANATSVSIPVDGGGDDYNFLNWPQLAIAMLLVDDRTGIPDMEYNIPIIWSNSIREPGDDFGSGVNATYYPGLTIKDLIKN